MLNWWNNCIRNHVEMLKIKQYFHYRALVRYILRTKEPEKNLKLYSVFLLLAEMLALLFETIMIVL